MKKIFFFLLLLASWRVTQGVIIGEPMGSAMQKVDVSQRASDGVLLFNKTGSPISFSVGYETVSSNQGKINRDEKNYYTPGRAFITGVIDSSGKFFPVKLFARDGSESKDAIKYLKSRPGEMALGAVHYELTKENNQYVLRERQPGLPPLPPVRPTATEEKAPEILTPDPVLPAPTTPNTPQRSTVLPALPNPPASDAKLNQAPILPQLSGHDPALPVPPTPDSAQNKPQISGHDPKPVAPK